MTKLPLTLEEIAVICEGTVVGDSQYRVDAITSAEQVFDNQIAYIANQRLLNSITGDHLGCFIVKSEWSSRISLGIVCDNPTRAFRLLLKHLHEKHENQQINPTAIIDDSAQLGQCISVGNYSQLGQNTQIGDNVVIGTHCVIGDNVIISDNTRLGNCVVVHEGCQIGCDCVIADGAVIGGQGFGFSFEAGNWEPIPQIGGVIIGSHVHIGSNTCIDRGAINDTIIGNNVIIDNLVHIAHNVEIGDGTAMAACVGVAGSTKIGKYCLFGGQVGIAGHINIVDGVRVNGGAKILKPIDINGTYSGAFNALPARQWNRLSIFLKKLENLFKREK